MTTPIRVAIDAHTIGRRATGNETYVQGLIGGLVANGEVDLVALVDPDAELPPQLATRRALLRRRGAVRRLLGEMSGAGRRWGADLLHVQYVRPPRSDVPVVTTIHDISFEHNPAFFTRRARLRMRATIPWSARHSAVVLTGSQHARRDIIEAFSLPEERVVVTPYSSDPAFHQLAPQETASRLARLGVPDGYLLCVGNIQPRKNLRRLLAAYAALAPSERPPLVVVGQRSQLSNDVFAAVRERKLESSVHFTGYVSNDELVALYNGARAFAYPSLYEGFGLPVLEALACAVPTLASNRTAIPEVAGDAALLVDPERVDELTKGLSQVLNDEALRSRLSDAGPARAARFSWTRCATATQVAYRTARTDGGR